VKVTGITLVTPSIPPRAQLLGRLLASAAVQTHPIYSVSVALDHDKDGAGPTRTRALRQAQTEWVAFADDDDELLPHHVATLLATAEETGADVVWPWFQVIGGSDPIACNRGLQWNHTTPHTFPITALVRNEIAQKCHFPAPLEGAGCSGEDFNFWMQMSNLGAKFHHVNEITWNWYHNSGNTAGLPSRW
jgi:hypothetical protein